jgi:hypothetical protein
MKTYILAVVLACLAIVVPAQAQVRSSANYAITVDQINSGGGAASSANYMMRGSIGQPFDTQPMSSANYANRPGFQASSPAPFLTVSPTSLLFGDQAVATSSVAQGVTLTNSGNVAIDLSPIGISGANAGDFGQGGCGSSIAVAGNCVTSVVFTPQAVGLREAALDISANAPSNATSVALSGTGVGVPDIDVSPTDVNFGNRALGVPGSLTLTMSNTGSATLNYSTSVTGAAAANFTVLGGGCGTSGSILATNNCQLLVDFTPSALGLRSATLVIASDDPDENPVNVTLSGTGIVKVRGDFNGDNRSDILWRHLGVLGSGENYLYPMDGTTILGTEGYLRTVADLLWTVAGIGDFDGDGKADVLWRNTLTGENYVYLMNGTTISSEGYLRSVADQEWKVTGVGDFNGDGNDDILWRHAITGENYVYPMNGLAILGTEGYIRTVPDPNWRIAGVGDLDGDGKADVVWRHANTGENYVYLMDGLTIKPTEGYLRTVVDPNWQIAGVGDYNGDGKADIVWRNAGTGENYLYPMDGTTILGTEGYLRTVADLGWEVKGTGDYDGDGKADVLWRHNISGDNYLYPMDGTTIKPTEGYLRNVAQPNWQVQNPK